MILTPQPLPQHRHAVATEAAAAVIAIAVAIDLAQHRRGTFLVLVDADGEIADDVFADAFLPLDLGDHSGRAVDVQQHEMRLAILVHAIGQRAYAPVFRLHDLAAALFDDAGHLGGQFFDLLGARILTREKNMLIKRHGCPFLVLTRFPAASPSRPLERTRGVAQKAEARDDGPTGPAASRSPKR